MIYIYICIYTYIHVYTCTYTPPIARMRGFTSGCTDAAPRTRTTTTDYKTTNANTDRPRQARDDHTDSSEHLAGYTLLLLGGESAGMGGYIQ